MGAGSAKSCTASWTGGVAIASEMASATTGRADDTKFELFARRSVAWSAM